MAIGGGVGVRQAGPAAEVLQTVDKVVRLAGDGAVPVVEEGGHRDVGRVEVGMKYIGFPAAFQASWRAFQ